jgi:hypothetical protein
VEPEYTVELIPHHRIMCLNDASRMYDSVVRHTYSYYSQFQKLVIFLDQPFTLGGFNEALTAPLPASIHRRYSHAIRSLARGPFLELSQSIIPGCFIVCECNNFAAYLRP